MNSSKAPPPGRQQGLLRQIGRSLKGGGTTPRLFGAKYAFSDSSPA